MFYVSGKATSTWTNKHVPKALLTFILTALGAVGAAAPGRFYTAA